MNLEMSISYYIRKLFHKYDNDKNDKKYKTSLTETTKGKKKETKNVNAEINEYSLNGECLTSNIV